METETTLTVGAAARLAGVTVRTLHHYDEIGLVSPAKHTGAGYRLYGRQEIERLQEVLLLREVGMGLDDIRRVVDEPDHRRKEALGNQRELLLARSKRLLAMVEVIERTIEADRKGTVMTAEDMLGVFGDFDPAEHQGEAEERWSGTAAYRESNRRVSGYTKEDWLQLNREAAAINRQLLDLMAKGVPADSVEAMDLAEEHRGHISKWFYQCTPDIHAGLGRMYVADLRFKENIDKTGEGLAQYLSKAIAADHERLGRTSYHPPMSDPLDARRL